MNKLTSLAVGAAFAFATIGAAHAASPVTGTWKLSTGVADAPCTVTLTADADIDNAGTAATTGDCNGTNVGRWKAVGNSLSLMENNGTLIAFMKPKGDTYEGTRISDGRKVALSH
ncbi:MAG TPA: AprI/Inh family metalloprotease inhibitor [Rhizomicrobium sp.]|nr:AprI/Inh family metalloprotease inhibitor [Rhizomicrobium sp.]